MKSVLLTGATGFIGRHCLASLLAKGYEVHAVSSKVWKGEQTGVRWYRTDLLDSRQVSELVDKVRPSHLLHCAWYVVPGSFYTSLENYSWVHASLNLLQAFALHGGQRAVMAGTCVEYDWRYGYCSENNTPHSSETVYGVCKHALQILFQAFIKETGLSGAWGRIFFLYGPHDHPSRLVSSVIRSLLVGEVTRCSHGNQIRDYLHVQDVANALVTLMGSSVQGPVNIASGRPVTIKKIVYKVARQLDREDLVQLGTIPTPAGESPLVVADVERLFDEVGWRPKYDLERGLEQTICWWRDRMSCEGPELR